MPSTANSALRPLRAASSRYWEAPTAGPGAAASTETLLTFALGRGVEYYDGPAGRRIVREAAADDYRFSALILGIVKSVPFQMRNST